MKYPLLRDDPGHKDVKAVVVNVENDAVPKMGDAGPIVDSGYVDSDASDRSIVTSAQGCCGSQSERSKRINVHKPEQNRRKL